MSVNSAQVTRFTWYCTAFQLLSMSPLVRMMPFSSTWAFFSLFSFSTLTFKRLRRTMAALPAFNKHVFLFVHINRTTLQALQTRTGERTGRGAFFQYLQ